MITSNQEKKHLLSRQTVQSVYIHFSLLHFLIDRLFIQVGQLFEPNQKIDFPNRVLMYSQFHRFQVPFD